MILSHRHKFIFIKTKKTAGTSIEIALSEFCGPDDIITPITPNDEEIRRSLGYRGPQNYKLPGGEFYNHISAKEIMRMISTEIWDSYFKFCVERNPWDKVISWYFWEYKTEPRPSIREFIQSGHASLVGGPGGIDLYTVNDRIVVDKVLLFEDLGKEMEFLRQQLDLQRVPHLPRAKSEFRKDKRNIAQFYDEQGRITVGKLFSREIARFGYCFPDPSRDS